MNKYGSLQVHLILLVKLRLDISHFYSNFSGLKNFYKSNLSVYRLLLPQKRIARYEQLRQPPSVPHPPRQNRPRYCEARPNVGYRATLTIRAWLKTNKANFRIRKRKSRPNLLSYVFRHKEFRGNVISIFDKVEKILKGSLDSILSPSPSVKIQIMG